MPVSVSLGSSCRLSGNITIADGVFIDDDVRLSGNITLASGSYIERNVVMSGNVQIGRNSVVGSFTTLSTSSSGHLVVGDDVLINTLSVIGASLHTEIGDHCIFAPFVQITDSTHGIANIDQLIKHAPITSKPVLLGKNVWLGSSVVITQGVTIGEGSVIGANSLVNKSIPAFAIAGGSPAKILKSRLAKDVE
jgi:UDP-3-O-[3-hydroxymyristoyl] glucosamine N-acyltransferase